MKKNKLGFFAAVGLVAVASLFTVCKATGANTTVYPDDTGGEAEYSPDLMVKFGVKTAPYELSSITEQNVTDTFNAMSAYLNSIAVADLVGENSNVRLGDYIDLPALSVEAYGSEVGEWDNNTDADKGLINITANIPITPDPLPFAGYQGTLLRLIVVGRNSFNNKNGNGVSAHLVFQFQNLPGTHRMNEGPTSEGGYYQSEMREYLRSITGPFVAGVPVSLLWAPKRMVAWSYEDTSGGGAVSVSDGLWLPTKWELTGSQSGSPLSETAENQARLEYYTGNDKLIKYDASGTPANWWSASPSALYQGAFVFADSTSSSGAQAAVDFAPAFCVRGKVEVEQEPDRTR
jgi:hypothetical protein